MINKEAFPVPGRTNRVNDLVYRILMLSLLTASWRCDAQESKSATDSRRRLALVIGNSAYQGAPLLNPGNDALSVKSALEIDGFRVSVALDASRKDLAKALDRFTGSLRRGDVALLYYSGHGVQIGGENLHRVRAVMDEIFGEGNFCAEIIFRNGRKARQVKR